MNKRIKELAYNHDIDAERLLAEMVFFSGESVDRVISEYMCSHPEALQRLRDCIDVILDEYAELIVRECLSVVDRFKFKMSAGADNVTVAIKEHFGVE